MPALSMSESAHYVTQASFYDRMQIGKVLTDRRITALRRKGWFGTGILAVDRAAVIARQRTKHRAKRKPIDLSAFV